MKKFALLIIALLVSLSAFAQRVSITDFCYYNGETMTTFCVDDVICRLESKGFECISTKTERAVGAGGFVYSYQLYTYYQRSTNVKVELSEGIPHSISFNSSQALNTFISEALRIGYISKSQYYSRCYDLTNYQEYEGIEGLYVEGTTIIFQYSEP